MNQEIDAKLNGLLFFMIFLHYRQIMFFFMFFAVFRHSLFFLALDLMLIFMRNSFLRESRMQKPTKLFNTVVIFIKFLFISSAFVLPTSFGKKKTSGYKVQLLSLSYLILVRICSIFGALDILCVCRLEQSLTILMLASTFEIIDYIMAQ